jgi:hypothetical protein
MKKSRFSDSQIMDALKRVEAGLSVPDVCRELGISVATFYIYGLPGRTCNLSLAQLHCSPLEGIMVDCVHIFGVTTKSAPRWNPRIQASTNGRPSRFRPL